MGFESLQPKTVIAVPNSAKESRIFMVPSFRMENAHYVIPFMTERRNSQAPRPVSFCG